MYIYVCIYIFIYTSMYFSAHSIQFKPQLFQENNAS